MHGLTCPLFVSCAAMVDHGTIGLHLSVCQDSKKVALGADICAINSRRNVYLSELTSVLQIAHQSDRL